MHSTASYGIITLVCWAVVIIAKIILQIFTLWQLELFTITFHNV